MSEDNELRFSRQFSLPQIGSAGQARLASCAVLVVGPGGLGSTATCMRPIPALGI